MAFGGLLGVSSPRWCQAWCREGSRVEGVGNPHCLWEPCWRPGQLTSWSASLQGLVEGQRLGARSVYSSPLPIFKLGCLPFVVEIFTYSGF